MKCANKIHCPKCNTRKRKRHFMGRANPEKVTVWCDTCRDKKITDQAQKEMDAAAEGKSNPELYSV
jgi:hypothetical protein